MKTNVAIVVDESGSMDILQSYVPKMVYGILNTLAKVMKETGLVYVVDLWTFNDIAKRLYSGYSPASLPRWLQYHPSSGTALNDAVVKATESLPRPRRNDANLVIVITDGEENSSTTHRYDFAEQIRKFQADGHHTFVFHVPPGHKYSFVRTSGIPADNVNEWEATEKGTREVEDRTSRGIETYSGLRAMGVTNSATYFTDASKVTSHDLQNKRALNFNGWVVGSQTTAKEFAERCTNKKYVIGQLFYQLMKPERVQANKEVVLQDKATKYIYAGKDIRTLIGIPAGKKVKVDPGNHAMYDVFIQSTSVNRILPRGTKVLIDSNRISDLPPTWDHTAVKKPAKLSESEKQLIGAK